MRRLALVLAALWLGISPAMADNTDTATTIPDMLGTPTNHVVAGEETFIDLMARYGVGYTELAAANPGIDSWIPNPGTVLTIPTAHLLPRAPRKGIVINLADQRLYWFPEPPALPASFPIGIGREGWGTPLGHTMVIGKRKDPVWVPPASIRAERPDLPKAIGPGPYNPLGAFALDLGFENYVIHGTNRPAGIGRRVSHGCIRMTNNDVAALFANTHLGTPVTIVNEAAKIGWSAGELWLEVHPTQAQADELEWTGAFTPAPISGIGTRILAAAGNARDRLDWATITQAVTHRRGVPVRITTPVP